MKLFCNRNQRPAPTSKLIFVTVAVTMFASTRTCIVAAFHTPGALTFRTRSVRTSSIWKRPAEGWRMSTTSKTEESTTKTNAMLDHLASKGITFPNLGKSVEEIPPRMRFAPSPTGSLHVGGARTALYNWLVAQRGKQEYGSGAAFVVRVEDTDLDRSTKESELSVLADLQWLGLTWDEGPDMEYVPYGPYRQSERNHIYATVANYLMEQGKAYKCFCTKEELEEMKQRQEEAGVPARYDGTWRDADLELVRQKEAEGMEYTVRFKVPPGARVVIDDAVRGMVSWDAESTVGDFILLRSNGVPVYNFCVAVDDAAMGISTVIRAEEHLTNTLRQGLILDALGAPRPRYAHCSLILGEDKQKLSKRHGATSCNQFRLDGFLPDAMINYLSLLGWNDGSDDEIYTREELIEAFDVDRIVKSPSVFDMGKLRWVNAQHLKRKSVNDILPLVREQFEIANLIKVGDESESTNDFIFAATTLAKQMLETTKDVVDNANAVLGYNLPPSYDALLTEEGSEEAKSMIELGYFYSIGRNLIQSFKENKFPLPDPTKPLDAFFDSSGQYPIIEDTQLGGAPYSFPQAYKVFMKNLAKNSNVKGKFLFHPIRLALTGEMSGQDVTKQLSLLSIVSRPVNGNPLLSTDMVVTLNERMERLEAFLETIPEQFRAPNKAESSDNTTTGQNKRIDQGTHPANDSSSNDLAGEDTSSSKDIGRASYEGPPITALDIRVGRIQRVWEHEEAEKLFCEEIDIGEDQPRMVASGLRPFFQKEDLEGRKVLVLCNLKERKLVGFPSHGMVLCASNSDHTDVRFISPPVDAKVGERVTVPGWDVEEPMAENKLAKKKVFEQIAPFLKTSQHGVPEFLGSPFMTRAGVCTSPLPNASVS